MTVSDEVLAERFSAYRSHLLSVAYRLTGVIADAEDAVQESWLRLSTMDGDRRGEIVELRAWLTTVVGRICLDRLRSAAVRRESYVGPWLPEPVLTPFGQRASEDPLEAVVRDDGVRIAAMVVLEKLTPEQRVAFVLHDAFSLPFAEVADILGCTDATARQHASRGRRAVADADLPARAPAAEVGELIERFVGALATGDVATMVSLLHPDVVLIGDGGGKARTARRHIQGADKIIRFFQGLLQQYGLEALGLMRPALVNGDLGMVAPDGPDDGVHHPLTRRATTFVLRDGKVATIYDIANPDKLTRLDQLPVFANQPAAAQPPA